MHLLVGGNQPGIIGGVVLHGHIVDEDGLVALAQHLEALVVSGSIGHLAAELRRAGEILDGKKLVKAHVGKYVLTVPVGGVVGMHGHRAIPELLELTREVLGRDEVVRHEGVHAGAQVCHRVPGQKLKLAVASARAKGTHVAHTLHDRVIDSLEAFGSPIVAAQAVENREVGERLVHDADDRWLELLELRHGGGAVDVGNTVDAAVPATGQALDERGRVASVVMLGFGRDHLLCARDEGGQESLAVVAVEWLPCVQLDAEGIVVADHGLPSQHGAGNECGAAVDRERQLGFAL